MLQTKDDPLIQYLVELRAREKSDTLGEMIQRLIAERGVRKILESLREEGFILTEEFFIPSESLEEDKRKLIEQKRFDFMVKKEDIEIGIFLKYSKEGDFVLTYNEIEQYYKLFQLYQDVHAIILVWIYENSPSLLLDLDYVYQLRNLLKTEKKKEFNVEDLKTLQEALQELFKIELPDWKISKYERESELEELNVQSIFNTALEKMIKMEKDKRYRLGEKIKAVNAIHACSVK